MAGLSAVGRLGARGYQADLEGLVLSCAARLRTPGKLRLALREGQSRHKVLGHVLGFLLSRRAWGVRDMLTVI